MADSGSPFINRNRKYWTKRWDKNGSAAVDGLGLVGRISGLDRMWPEFVLTDISWNPIKIKRNNQKGILIGDNSPYPVLEFVKKKHCLILETGYSHRVMGMFFHQIFL